MINKLRGWFRPSKIVIEKPVRVLPLKQDVHFTQGVLHACVTLDPDTFEQLIGNARLPATKWYRALWLVQHNPKIGVTALADELKISWPTAQAMKERILSFITIPAITYSNELDES